jgi:hypothetical protein
MRAAARAFQPLGQGSASSSAITKDKGRTCLCIPDPLCNSSPSATVAWPIRPPDPVNSAGHLDAADLIWI